MIYTKKVGAVSADCVKSEDAEGWTCKLDGVDISGVYKETEPSSPGVPTACKGVALPGGVGPTFCEVVGPFSEAGGSEHRQLSASHVVPPQRYVSLVKCR